MDTIDSVDFDSFDCVLRPRIDLSSSTVPEEMTVLMEALHANPGPQVVLDLSANKTIDSQGISLVVGLHKECLKDSRQLLVLVASPLIVKVFQMMQLDKHLNVRRLA